jgi:hypothetical protein
VYDVANHARCAGNDRWSSTWSRAREVGYSIRERVGGVPVCKEHVAGKVQGSGDRGGGIMAAGMATR